MRRRPHAVGISLLLRLEVIDEALKEVAGFLGVTPSQNGRPKPSPRRSPIASNGQEKKGARFDQLWFLDVGESADKHCRQAVESFAKAKGLDPEQVSRAKFRPALWPRRAPKAKRNGVIVFEAYRPTDWSKPVAAVLYRLNGCDFPASDKLPARKSHLLRDSSPGIIIIGTAEELGSADILWKCEGLTDALALAAHLPEKNIAFTNTNGAKSFPQELAAVSKGKKLVVCHDADQTGEDGVPVVALHSAEYATQIQRVRLPYDVVPSHGKDILQRLPEPEETQKVIAERQGDVDVEEEEAGILEDYFARQLKGVGYDTEGDQIHIPSRIATRWFNHAHNDNQKVGSVSRIINQLSDEGRLTHIRRNRCKAWGRGFIWVGENSVADQAVCVDLETRWWGV